MPQLIKGSALELIDLSDRRDQIIHSQYNPAKAAELLAESEGHATNGDVEEYWGTREDGDTEMNWRVHLHH